MLIEEVSDNLFRASVGVMLVNRGGKILALERSDVPGAWQMPQGGIEPGEAPLPAAVRELWEETSVNAGQIELLAEAKDWLAYELPPAMRRTFTGRGQVQKWFLFRLNEASETILLSEAQDQEFMDWKWMKIDELIDLTISFRKSIYQRLKEEFSEYLST